MGPVPESTSTYHNSGLLDTFTAHHITSFVIIAPSSDSSRTLGVIHHAQLAVTVPLCTGTRGLDDFLWVTHASHCAQLDLIPVDIISKFPWIPALILALTCLRLSKFITRPQFHQLLRPGSGNYRVRFHGFFTVTPPYSGHRMGFLSFAARFYCQHRQRHVVSPIFFGKSSRNPSISNILDHGYHLVVISQSISISHNSGLFRHLHGSPYPFVCDSCIILCLL
jgi:hypothetical protein